MPHQLLHHKETDPPTVSNNRTSLYYILEQVVQHKGPAQAIWSHAESLTFAQLYARTNQYAQWLLTMHVQPGALVVLYMANSPDFLCLWYGLLAIGAAPAAVNTNLAGPGLVHCVELAQAALVVADGDDALHARLDGVRAELEASGHVVVRLADVRREVLGLAAVRPADALRKDVGPGSPLVLAYTSGTTGLPKAIIFPMMVGVLSSLAVCPLPLLNLVRRLVVVMRMQTDHATEAERIRWIAKGWEREAVQLHAILPRHRRVTSLPNLSSTPSGTLPNPLLTAAHANTC